MTALAAKDNSKMAVGDIYMLKDKHRATWGTEFLNTYFYIGSGDGLALNLAQAFADEIVADIADLQQTDITHYELEALSLFDPTDFGVVAIDVDGTQTTETSAPFTAINFSLRLPTRAIKAGSKRIGPVPEDVVVNGVVTDSAYITLLQSVVADLDNQISPTGEPSKTFDPVVVKRIVEGTPPNVSYRLPTSFGEAVYAPVIAALVNLNVSHQVTRKR